MIYRRQSPMIRDAAGSRGDSSSGEKYGRMRYDEYTAKVPKARTLADRFRGRLGLIASEGDSHLSR
jgi:hypothetical protein